MPVPWSLPPVSGTGAPGAVPAPISALEALVAAALVRRCIGSSRTFERGEDAVEFVAIAGLSSAIAATAAAGAAWALSPGPHPPAWAWWTRWQSDAIGINVAAPVVLGWSAAA